MKREGGVGEEEGGGGGVGGVEPVYVELMSPYLMLENLTYELGYCDSTAEGYPVEVSHGPRATPGWDAGTFSG